MRLGRAAVSLVMTGTCALVGVQLSPLAGPAWAASATPGSAAAAADMLGIVPAMSGLALTTTYGESKAAFEGSEAQASSATINLGSLGLVLANTSLCGQTDLPAKDQPQPLAVNSESGPGTADNGSSDVGSEQVSAGQSPLAATATTTPVSLGLPGILTVEGHSQAAVSYTSAGEQTADSTVSEDVSLLGGLVQMKGLTWTAHQIMGGPGNPGSSFSFGQVEVAGMPLQPPNASPDAEVEALNTVLAPLGFSLILPVQSVDQATGTVSVEPLALRFSGSSVERTLVSPVANAITSLEAALANTSTPGSDCAQFKQLAYNLGSNLDTVVNVVLAVAQGAGSLEFDLGGATAGAQAAPDYANPFDAGGGVGPSGLDQPSAGGGTNAAGDAGLAPALGSSAPDTATVAAAPGSEPVAAAPAVAVTATTGLSAPRRQQASLVSSIVCQSSSPARSPGCWRGLGPLAAAAAVGVGAALFAADYRLGDRRRLRYARRGMRPSTRSRDHD